MSRAEQTDREVLAEIGHRLRRYRLQQNVPQHELARLAGIGTRTLRNAESGQDTQLSTLVRILRALGRLDAVDALLPPPQVSPMELLHARGQERQRARRKRDD